MVPRGDHPAGAFSDFWHSRHFGHAPRAGADLGALECLLRQAAPSREWGRPPLKSQLRFKLPCHGVGTKYLQLLRSLWAGLTLWMQSGTCVPHDLATTKAIFAHFAGNLFLAGYFLPQEVFYAMGLFP